MDDIFQAGDHRMEDAMEGKYLPITSIRSGVGEEVLPDLYCLCIQIVNVCFVGSPETAGGWVLIDAGMPESADVIVETVDKRFGPNSKPRAIVLTHGHFDHVGAVVDLVEKWTVPVYAHPLEIPFLTGQANYPEPDGSVEGGLVAKISPLFPNEAVNLASHVQALPADGHVPEMPGWRWVHTPGHSPGHVSLYRDTDGALIAGDAFITVRQDSLFKVLTQYTQISGPPRYFTTDWQAAWNSVKSLEALKPRVAVTGHGRPVAGDKLAEGLRDLLRDFGQVAIPDYGRFV